MVDGTLRIEYQFPMYMDNVHPVGFLSAIEKRHHACFHYYIMAQKLFEQAGGHAGIEGQIRYDDARWLDKNYGNIALSTSIRYGLSSPEEFLKESIKEIVQLEIARVGWPKPDPEYWNVTPDKLVYS